MKIKTATVQFITSAIILTFILFLLISGYLIAVTAALIFTVILSLFISEYLVAEVIIGFFFILYLPYKILQKFGIFYRRDIFYLIPPWIFAAFCFIFLISENTHSLSSISYVQAPIFFLIIIPILFFITILVWWVLSSSIDGLLSYCKNKKINLDPNRFVSLRESAKYKDLKIGLALSGGGYRAALMHAGTLAASEHFGIVFTNISSVSGGSIIGAYYAAGGSPEEFRNTIKVGSLDLKRGLLRVQNVHKLLFGRSTAQAELLDKIFFDGMTLENLSKDDSPKIVFCTVDLLTGNSVGISPSFIIKRFPLKPWEKHVFDNTLPYYHFASQLTTDYKESTLDFRAKQKVSSLVAASGAFPLAFDAVELTFVPKEKSSERLLLADGGITDNTGLDMLIEAHRIGHSLPLGDLVKPDSENDSFSEWRQDFIISSDASALFESKEDLKETTTLGKVYVQLKRAIDIIHRNAGSRTILSYIESPRMHLFSPEHQEKEEISFRRIGSSFNLGSRKMFKELENKDFEFLIKNLPQAQKLDQNEIKKLEGLEIEGNSINLRQLAEDFYEDSKQSPTVETIRNKIYQIISFDFDRCLLTFRESSTLEAIFPKDHTDKLYRLGIYLFAFEWKRLELDLDFLQGQKHRVLTILNKILKEANIALNDNEKRVFTTENELYTMLLDKRQIESKIPLRGMDTKLEYKNRNFLEVSIAHRLAHVIHQRDNENTHKNSQGSLMEEITGSVEIDREQEKKIDEITVSLLKKAGFDLNSGIILIEEAKANLGLNNISRNIDDRLSIMKDAIEANK